jgi:uncharacterized protein
MWRKWRMPLSAALPVIDVWLALACAIVFGAAVVRGFSGFGFSLLAISGLSLIYPLREILPPMLMMELAASINLLPTIWKDIHWRSFFPLLVGALIGTPIGIYALSNLPPAPMQVALSAFMLVSVSLMWIGYGLKSMPNLPATIAAGAASGLANGAFGIGGPPVILFYFASPAGAAAGRASLTAFFLAIDIIWMTNPTAISNLIHWSMAVRAAVYLPFLLGGIWIGHHAFKGVDEAKFRKAIMVILMAMALLIGAKGIAGLL